MTILSVFVAALLLGLLLAVASALVLYNGLVAARQECVRAWHNIDVLLKQRHDELPRLVEVCRAHMAFEKGTLERLVVARMSLAAARDVPAQTRASQAVSDALRQLFAVAENYPDLKADESFARLSARITELENQIADPAHIVRRVAKGRRSARFEGAGPSESRSCAMSPRRRTIAASRIFLRVTPASAATV